MILVYFFAIFVGITWAGRMILEKRVIFQKSFFFYPLILFFLSQLLSTIFSIDPHTSFFGYYSRFHGGLLSTASYLFLFWALLSNGEKDWVKKFLNLVLISTSLVAGFGVLEHFGIDAHIWVQDVQNRVFSTIGQPNWLAAYLDIVLLLVLGRLFLLRENKEKIINTSLFSLFYLCLLFTKSRSGFLGFIAGIFVFLFSLFLVTNKKKIKKTFSLFLIPGLIILLLGLLVGTPFSPSLANLFRKQTTVPQEQGLGVTSVGESNITPSSQIRKIVWNGALKLWQQNFLLGTGVETFAYSYYWVRPAEHNLTSEWDFLYNKAHNEYLNLAATSGILGLISYLSIPVLFFFWLKGKIQKVNRAGKKKEELFLLISFSSVLSTILITNFFGFSVVVIGLWFFLILALASLLFKSEEKKLNQKKYLFRGQKVALVGVGIVGLFLVYKTYSYWQADYYLAQSLKGQQGGLYEESLALLNKAIALRGNESLYYDKLSLTLANLAWVADKQDDFLLAEEYINQAIKVSDRALSLSPYQLNFYRDRAKMFFVLSQIELNYLEESLETIIAAIELAPTDAKLYYNAGLMFASLGDKETGDQYLKRALELKPNYEQVKLLIEDI